MRNQRLTAIALSFLTFLTQSLSGEVTQVVRFDFNAGHLLSRPAAVGAKSSGNMKAIRQNISDAANNAAHTFDVDANTPANLNKYERWAKGMGTGEGISSFNIFLRGDLQNTASWGQTLKLSDPLSNAGISASVGGNSGWQARVVNFSEIYGDASWGYTVQFFTTDDSKRINYFSDLPGFSFTAPVEIFGSPSMAVEHGNQYTVWFGTQNRATDPAGWIKPLEFDNNWNGSTSDTFAFGNDSVWNGTMNLYATVIPEPSTGSLLLVGAALACWRRRRCA